MAINWKVYLDNNFLEKNHIKIDSKRNRKTGYKKLFMFSFGTCFTFYI